MKFRGVLTLLIWTQIIMYTGTLSAQNKLDIEGRAHITERLQLNPSCCTSGEFIVNQDGVSISFFTANSERFKINNDGTVALFKADTVLTGASTLVRKTDGTLAVRQYKIGDIAQGGIIFWLDETGAHGLVADIADISIGIQWSNGVTRVTNASGDGVRSGAMNTMLIIAQQTVDNPSGNFAALICAKLFQSSGDWYLPSISELTIMYNNLHFANLGNFQNETYWSSTEQDAGLANALDFSSGNPSILLKPFTNRVRAIRAF